MRKAGKLVIAPPLARRIESATRFARRLGAFEQFRRGWLNGHPSLPPAALQIVASGEGEID
jgi:hypothetical protein